VLLLFAYHQWRSSGRRSLKNDGKIMSAMRKSEQIEMRTRSLDRRRLQLLIKTHENVDMVILTY